MEDMYEYLQEFVDKKNDNVLIRGLSLSEIEEIVRKY